MNKSASLRLTLDASNLRNGGAVQVAASIVDEISLILIEGRRLPFELDVYVSPEVNANISESARRVLRPVIRRLTPLAMTSRKSRATFLVFGPGYFWPRTRRRLMGYADVTSVYPEFVQPGLKGRLRRRLSHRELRLADRVIVETDALATRVASIGVSPNRICVIPNAANRAVVLNRPTREDHPSSLLRKGADRKELLLAFPSRWYAHKNFNFLGKLGQHLSSFGLDARYVLTLKPDEMSRLDQATRERSTSVSEISVSEVASLLWRVDGVIFPSLLEAFSATPIEAMTLGVPLIASDRDFVRSVAGNAALYIDPVDAASAAETIARSIGDTDGWQARRDLGIALAGDLPTARQRADRVLDLMTEAAGHS